MSLFAKYYIPCDSFLFVKTCRTTSTASSRLRSQTRKGCPRGVALWGKCVKKVGLAFFASMREVSLISLLTDFVVIPDLLLARQRQCPLLETLLLSVGVNLDGYE